MQRSATAVTRLALASMGLLALARPAAACSPIVPLSILYSGPTVGGAVAGAGVGLALVVALKCGVFAALCRELRPASAAGLMFLANVVTTILGVVMAIGPASGGPLLIVILPVVIWSAVRTAGHLEKRAPVAVGLVALFILSFVLWGLAEATGESRGPLPVYWGLKFLYVASALTVGFTMTAAWEAYLVQKWSASRAASGGKDGGRDEGRDDGRDGGKGRPPRPSPAILRAAFRANAAAFGFVALAGAVLVLPARLASPDFLYNISKRIVETFA